MRLIPPQSVGLLEAAHRFFRCLAPMDRFRRHLPILHLDDALSPGILHPSRFPVLKRQPTRLIDIGSVDLHLKINRRERAVELRRNVGALLSGEAADNRLPEGRRGSEPDRWPARRGAFDVRDRPPVGLRAPAEERIRPHPRRHPGILRFLRDLEDIADEHGDKAFKEFRAKFKRLSDERLPLQPLREERHGWRLLGAEEPIIFTLKLGIF